MPQIEIGGAGVRVLMSKEQKIAAASAALDEVTDGMRLGIGTGSTAEEFVRLLADKVASGLQVIGVPTSERTAELCNQLGIPLSSLDELPELDLTIDGADEIDPQLNLIKGGGGALLREKIVACASRRMIVIADQSKLVDRLGAFALPIEVNEFGLASTARAIEQVFEAQGMNGSLSLRMVEAKPFVTDGGHLLFDASFGLIRDAGALDKALNGIPGVVEHGLFVAIADTAYVAGPDRIEKLAA